MLACSINRVRLTLWNGVPNDAGFRKPSHFATGFGLYKVQGTGQWELSATVWPVQCRLHRVGSFCKAGGDFHKSENQHAIPSNPKP